MIFIGIGINWEEQIVLLSLWLTYSEMLMLMDLCVGFYLQDTTILLFAGSFWYLRLKFDFVKAGHGYYQKGL